MTGFGRKEDLASSWPWLGIVLCKSKGQILGFRKNKAFLALPRFEYGC